MPVVTRVPLFPFTAPHTFTFLHSEVYASGWLLYQTAVYELYAEEMFHLDFPLIQFKAMKPLR